MHEIQKIDAVNQPAIFKLKNSPESLVDHKGHPRKSESSIYYSDYHRNLLPEAQEILFTFLADKGFKPKTIRDLTYDPQNYYELRYPLLSIMDGFTLRHDEATTWQAKAELLAKYPDNEDKYSYFGTAEENVMIDLAIKMSQEKISTQRKTSGDAATRYYYSGNSTIGRARLNAANVIILGGGPATILALTALRRVGFNNNQIQVIDRNGSYNGIWNYTNVSGLSKNNPFKISFESQFILKEAPGSGKSIQSFLDRMTIPKFEIRNQNNPSNYHNYLMRNDEGKLTYVYHTNKRSEKNSGRVFYNSVPSIIKAEASCVQPGDLKHVVEYKVGKRLYSLEAPIVINALGGGKPRPLSSEDHMSTDVNVAQSGIRWQQIITAEKARKLQGKSLVFIGLGNSTAEMMVQIESYREQGLDIPYKVLTHYPKTAIENPNVDIFEEGRSWRVFRDIERPNLTKLAGDLGDIRAAYYKALFEQKIICGVKSWTRESNTLTARDKDDAIFSLKCDQLYTLIGYRQDPNFLRNMGMIVSDEKTSAIYYDYDGEIQRNPGEAGRDRVWPGYFGLGAILKTDWNPNAEVIPGILHRLYDLMFTLQIRAAEINS